MELPENDIDPMAEVRKLQDMVRKLELQNQQLRNRQSSGGAADNGVGEVLPSDDVTDGDNTDSGGGNKTESLDDVGLINIEDIDVAEEDSWLYRSPKGMSKEDQSINPYKWLRKDVEDPLNKELQYAKRALAYKLDELAILNPTNILQNIFGPPEHGSLFSKPPLGRMIDTRTFTRGKKKRGSYDDSQSMSIMESIGQEVEDESPSCESNTITTTLSQSPTPRVPQTDVIDVQEIARMQEESLRQSSPSSTPKRTTRMRPLHLHSPSSSNNHYQDLYNNSAHSSPPESLNGSNNSLDKPDSFHHSLPNLSKDCNGIVAPRRLPNNGSGGALPPPRSLMLSNRRGPAASSVERRLGVASRSVSNLRSASPRRSPTHHSNGMTPGGLPVAPVAPMRVTTSPTNRTPGGSPVKTGLPKLSKIPSPKPRSGIPVPSSSRNNAANDTENELWSDGCY